METTASFIGNVEVLSEKMNRDSWYNTFWAKFSNFNGLNDDNGNSKDAPGGHPIKVWSAMQEQGRDNMLIPFMNDLAGNFKYGDSVLKGSGEDQSMRFMRAYINQWRTAVKAKTGAMDDQRTKIYDLTKQAMPGLIRLLAKAKNQYIYEGLYYGINTPLSNAVTGLDGLGIKRRLHPHWFEYSTISTVDTLVSIGTDGRLKTKLLLDAATEGTGTGTLTKMTTNLLEDLRVKCMELRIPQMTTKDGMPYWVMIVHPKQAKDLRQDQDFKAFNGTKLASPELNGSIGVYAGFAIYEDIVGIRGWDATAHDLYNTGIFELSTASNYNAVIVGNDAIGKAVAMSSEFNDEIDDFKNIKEIGCATIDGINRVDFATEGTNVEAAFARVPAGGFCDATPLINTSSMIVMTA